MNKFNSLMSNFNFVLQVWLLMLMIRNLNQLREIIANVFLQPSKINIPTGKNFWKNDWLERERYLRISTQKYSIVWSRDSGNAINNEKEVFLTLRTWYYFSYDLSLGVTWPSKWLINGEYRKSRLQPLKESREKDCNYAITTQNLVQLNVRII